MPRTRMLFLFVSYLITVYLISPTYAILCDKESNNVENNLKKSLYCNGYNVTEKPAESQSENFIVDSFNVIHVFNLFERANTLEVIFTQGVIWYDTRLKWNASEWNNITKLVAQKDEIWIPHFETIDHKYKKLSSTECSSVACILLSTGMVICYPICTLNAKCTLNSLQWPYDARTCKMLITPIEGTLEPSLFCSSSRKSLSHGSWRLVSLTHKQTTLNNKYERIVNQTVDEYEITIQRNSDSAIIGFHSSLIVLALLNLFICWLRSMLKERIILVLLAVYSHYMSLWHMVFQIDIKPIPNAAWIFLTSLLMTCILLIVTLVTRWLHNRQGYPSGTTLERIKRISDNRIVKSVLDADYLSFEHKLAIPLHYAKFVRYNWQLMAKLLDRAMLIGFTLIYIFLFYLLLPVRLEPLDGADYRVCL